LRQCQQPLVAIEHASWEEPRFFVVLPYGNHTLYYRAAHNLLVLRQADGSLCQLCTMQEFNALTPTLRVGLQALIDQYVPDFVAPAQAPRCRRPLWRPSILHAPIASFLNRLAGEGAQNVAHFTDKKLVGHLAAANGVLSGWFYKPLSRPRERGF
jgi:hypothetical protein